MGTEQRCCLALRLKPWLGVTFPRREHFQHERACISKVADSRESEEHDMDSPPWTTSILKGRGCETAANTPCDYQESAEHRTRLGQQPMQNQCS
jgi:hypothetical protein